MFHTVFVGLFIIRYHHREFHMPSVTVMAQ